MTYHSLPVDINEQRVTLESGRFARQANGSATMRLGDTIVLATACEGNAREDISFFPLSVEFIAKTYAVGKIPGGFFKREGKPSNKEVLSARLIDRPIRPLFPEGYKQEIQIINTVISADDAFDADVLGITASSCALCLSDIPFKEPIAGVRVGLVDDKIKIFPTLQETEDGGLDMIVAGSEKSILMVEGGAWEISEDLLLEAIEQAHTEIKKLVALQHELIGKCGKEKKVFTPPELPADLETEVTNRAQQRIKDVNLIGDKKEREKELDAILENVQEELAEVFPEQQKQIAGVFHDIEKRHLREVILSTGTRIAGRDLDTVRDISIELDLLPRAHGSALFTRGETQALASCTLGTKLDEQRIDYLQAEFKKTYMLHYNFPPFSVGETKRLTGVSRREVGHGHLAERSLTPVLPKEDVFPYTIRIVSDVLESNGSSSMASICGASLALMTAGVPVKTGVAGVAMGLIKEEDRMAILTDILGTEDHLGDMDFKVAGSKDGITAIQMDIKIDGITIDIMRQALQKAHTARMNILDIMNASINQPREKISQYAPHIHSFKINPSKIRDLIGPSGKVVKEIQDTYNVTVCIDDDGTVNVYATNREDNERALEHIKQIVVDPEVGEVYDGKVKDIKDFGAFVEIRPGRDGLVHISELEHRRVNKVTDVLSVGDIVKVKVIGIDNSGKIKLSRKALIEKNG
jgi:polyribonucleotide nucleotidyltransferase